MTVLPSEKIRVFYFILLLHLFSRRVSDYGARRREASKKVAEPSICLGLMERRAEEAVGVGMEVASLVTSRAWNPLMEIGDLGKSKSLQRMSSNAAA